MMRAATAPRLERGPPESIEVETAQGGKVPHALLQTQILKGEVGSGCFLVGGRKRPSRGTGGPKKVESRLPQGGMQRALQTITQF